MFSFPTITEWEELLFNFKKLHQIQDSYGKIISVVVEHKKKNICLPIYPSPPSNDISILQLSQLETKSLADAKTTMAFFIQMSKHNPNFLPTSSIGDLRHIYALQFSNGQLIPVRKSIKNISILHFTQRIYEDVNKTIEESRHNFIHTRTVFVKTMPWELINDHLEIIEGTHGIQFTYHSIFLIRKNIGLFTIHYNNTNTSFSTTFGLHAYINPDLIQHDKYDDIPFTQNEPVFPEIECITSLMNVWRYSNYKIKCRPYRYVLNLKNNKYTKFIIENGHQLRLHTPVHCLERFQGYFRNERLRHIELFHHTDTSTDVEAHLNHFEILKQNKEHDEEIEKEMKQLQREWTSERQQNVFSILYSTDVTQSKITKLKTYGYSDKIIRALLHNPHYIQEYTPSITKLCPSTIRVSGKKSLLFKMEELLRKSQKDYFINLLPLEDTFIQQSTSLHHYIMSIAEKPFSKQPNCEHTHTSEHEYALF